MVDVKGVMKSILVVVGAEHAARLISETTLTNGRPTIPRLIILFKILKFMHGVMSLYWNGIHGQHFQRLKKLEKVVMEPFFELNQKYQESLLGIMKKISGVVMKVIMRNTLH